MTPRVVCVSGTGGVQVKRGSGSSIAVSSDGEIRIVAAALFAMEHDLLGEWGDHPMPPR